MKIPAWLGYIGVVLSLLLITANPAGTGHSLGVIWHDLYVFIKSL